MVDLTQESHIQKTIITLLNDYSFDSGDRPIAFVIANWFGQYPSRWIVAAVIEALYQGRYKTISVEQILIIWQRRGTPIYHFNHEFERIVCNRFSEKAAEAYQPDSKTGLNNSATPIKNTESRDDVETLSIISHLNGLQPSQPEQFEITWTPESINRCGQQSNHTIPLGMMAGEDPNSSVLTSGQRHDDAMINDDDGVHSTQAISTNGLSTNNVNNSIETVPAPALIAPPKISNPLLQSERTLASSVITPAIHPLSDPVTRVNRNGRLSKQPQHPWPQKSQPLLPFDPTQYKVPLPSFEPEPPSCPMPENWEYWCGQPIRYCPIHQFQPDKAPLNVYNKLKAIARLEPEPN